MFKRLKSKKITALLVVLAMILSIITPMDLTVFAAENDTVEIQVLATSDLHGRFYPYDYATDSAYTKGSLAQVAAKVKELKTANPNTIVVDNGDTIQGNSSALFNNDEMHPMVAAMNAIGYDTWTLGNHEFNYGVPTLEKIVSKFDGTILCGNVFEKNTNKPLGQAYKIVEFKQNDGSVVKVGIIGMVTPHILKWDGPKLENYYTTDPTEETRKVADEIKDKVDVLVAVVHMGQNSEYGNGDSAKEIAAKVPELAAIVAGHAHDTFADVRQGQTLIVEPKSSGDFLSQINIKLTKKDGKYVISDRMADVNGANIALNNVESDKETLEKLQPYHEKAVADARIVIGKLQGSDLAPASKIKGIPEAQLGPSALITLINKVQLKYGKVEGAEHQVSAAAIFNPNANIKVGDITKAGTSNIYQYENTLVTLKIDGKLLKKYMEWSANYYNTFKEGDLNISFNQDVRIYNYDMFSGVKYEINISKPAGSRIEKLTYNDNTPVKDDDIIYLTVNDYRGNSTLLTGIFKGEKVEKVFDSSNDQLAQVRDMIKTYIEETGTIKAEVENNWKLTGYNWDASQRAIAEKLVNEGKLSLPTSQDGRTPNVRSLTMADINSVIGTTIDVLSINDFHGALKEDGKNVGAAKLAGEINRIKALNPNTIMVAAGDLYQGSAISNLKKGAPVSEFLKLIGLEASAIGNHEFDWGYELIPGWAKDGGFDFLATNIYDKATGKPVTWAKPYKVIEKGGKRIGFVGIATPETAFKTKPDNVKDFEFRDAVESVNIWAKYLRENEKVDAVIALTHLGAAQDSKTQAITGEAADLAKNAKGIDAVISAHSHQPVNGKVNGIPVVQARNNGRALARLSFVFDKDGKLSDVINSVDTLYERTNLVVDQKAKELYEKYAKELQPILGEVLATLDTDLTHDRDEGLSVLGQFTAKLMAQAAGVQIGITNGGGVRTPIAKGTITMGNMYDVFPFDNTLVTLKLKGSDLKRVIEHGIMPEGFGWGQYYGITVYYDKDAKAGNRITSMRLLDGTPIEMDKYYTVVTNDFMVDKGDNYNFTGAIDIVDTGIPIRDAMVDLIKKMGHVSYKYETALIAGPDTTKGSGGSGNLPKTGSMVNTTTMVSFGSLIAIVGAALFLNDKRRKENQAA